MQIVYSPNGAVVAGLTGYYRNPDYFEKADNGASKVVLVGAYANIEQAYQAIGVVVEHYQAKAEPKAEPKTEPKAEAEPKAEVEPKTEPKAEPEKPKRKTKEPEKVES